MTQQNPASPDGELLPCPFCGTANPWRGDHHGSGNDLRSGRTITCRESTCHAYMFRARCWYDDEHTRLETTQELDAALTERWNRRAALASAPRPDAKDKR